MVMFPLSAARIAVVFTTAIAVVVAAAPASAAAPGAGAVMYPNDNDGDNDDDPEGLIVCEEPAVSAAAVVVAVAIVVTGCVHGSDSLLNRFLTPYYSPRNKVCAAALRNPRGRLVQLTLRDYSGGYQPLGQRSVPIP